MNDGIPVDLSAAISAIPTALVHELGHYSVARWAGVRVEVFSIGFGPELFGWTAASGTRWKFRRSRLAVTSKCSVIATGERGPGRRQRLDRRSEEGGVSSPIPAGPGADHRRRAGRQFRFRHRSFGRAFHDRGQPQAPAVVDQVVAGSAAERAGLRAGDRILAIDGASIAQFEDLRRIVVDSRAVPWPRGSPAMAAKLSLPWCPKAPR